MGDPLRVLYIDDDPGLARLMRRTLASRGMTIEHAGDAATALALLQDGAYDVIALDHDLGSTTGLDLLPQIRALASASPVIYVTGSDDARIAVAALKAGAVDYVWKDVEGHYRELFVEAVAAAFAQEKLKREKEHAEQEVRQAKERAELLLSEVNHRVANSLALVSALARLQANAATEDGAKLALQEMRARISAIAGIHRRLYTSSDVRVVEMDAYMQHLVQDLGAAMDAEQKRHRIDLNVDRDLRLPTDKAVSLGVLITELVTNAYKYAYPDGATGGIRIALRRIDGGQARLVVEDDGIGWHGEGAPQGTGVGSRVIKAMATNLKGALDYDRTHRGTRAVMEFSIT